MQLKSKDIKADRTSEGFGQLLYGPNRGEFYDTRSNRKGNYFDPLKHFAKQIRRKSKAIRKEKKASKKRIAKTKLKREKRVAHGDQSLIDGFEAAYLVQDILLKSGYEQDGEKFRHPNSESGSFSLSIKDGRAHSLSTSDKLFSRGKGAHSAFSAFNVLFHNGDINSALKDAGDNWLSIDGESWNKGKQRGYMQSKPISQKSDPDTSPTKTLLSLCANGESKKMKKQMLADVFVLDGLAILGQWTVIYGAPNTGKTLITLWLLCEAISKKRINGADVFYANCDDSFRGSSEKLTIAETAGFNMLIPNINDFKAGELLNIIDLLVERKQAKGKIIVLDTLKKFTDLMDKKASSEFGNKARIFVSAGGTIICLAHVNKRKMENGKSIHAGTSDIRDDADCCYTIEHINEENDTEGVKLTIEFENTKSRGDIELFSSFKFRKIAGAAYQALFDSVGRVSNDERDRVRNNLERKKRYEAEEEIIKSVLRIIPKMKCGKGELVKQAMADTAESRRKIIVAIDAWTGSSPDGLWHIDKQNKNKHVYKLNKIL